VLGLTGVLVALVVLTIILAGVFLVRPSFTAGATGKILAFIGLCVLPTLCIGTGMSFHMERSKQTAYCISCHSMVTHGQSLYVLNPSYIPAQHFQNHLVQPNQACYTCHTDYTMYGPLKDKLKGLRYVYMEYVSSPPKTIHLDGTYNNSQCLHCHAGTRDFEANLNHMAPMGSLVTNQISCISGGCHSTIHNASEVANLKMWKEGTAPAPVEAEAAPAPAEPAAASGSSKAPAGNSAGNATSARGKSIFESQHCAACHGDAGVGASGPALTHTSSRYPPAKLTAVLKTPTAQMKAAGMTPLSVNAADMKALVSYVDGLGGTSAASAAKPPAAGSSSPASAKVKPGAKSEPPKAASAATPPASASPSAAPAAPSKAPAGKSASDASAAHGKSIFESQHCAACHGEAGAGGSGPALTHTSAQYAPAQLTAVLKTPTPKMKAAGMAPVSVNAADMKALVSYVDGLGKTSAAPAATAPAAASTSPAPAAAGTAATAPAAASTSPAPAAAGTPASAAPSKAPAGNSASDAATAHGKNIFESQHCAACHGEAGGGASGPALTHTSAQYPPAQLTAVLKAPTAKMKAAGMTPLTVNAADMEALVSYVDGLGKTSAASAATAAPSNAPAGNSASDAAAAQGKSIFKSHGCAACHGEAGGGASGPALTHIQYSPAQLTAVLKAPTAPMRAAGMAPVPVDAADMEALVSYVTSLKGTSAAPAGPVTATTPSKPAPKKKGALHRLFAPGAGPVF
jgi:mono/diheme cytochrome c family protein